MLELDGRNRDDRCIIYIYPPKINRFPRKVKRKGVNKGHRRQ